MSALVLTGNLQIGPTSGSLVDMSAEVTAFHVSAQVDTIEVPATMTTSTHGRGGAADYAVEIGYLSNDIAAALFKMLWDAVDTGTKTLAFTGTMRAGTVTTSNPSWSGTFIVVESTLGSQAETLSQGKATFPMTGPPVKATA